MRCQELCEVRSPCDDMAELQRELLRRLEGCAQGPAAAAASLRNASPIAPAGVSGLA